MGDTKFVRIHGRIVPIHGKGSAPSGVSKRYGGQKKKPAIKKLSGIQRAAVASVGAAAGALLSRGKGIGKLAFGTAIGAIVGTGISGIKLTKRAKGESTRQLSNRVSKK